MQDSLRSDVIEEAGLTQALRMLVDRSNVQEPIEWLAASVLEYQHRPTSTPNKGQRLSRPV
jgi:hypothetical protein